MFVLFSILRTDLNEGEGSDNWNLGSEIQAWETLFYKLWWFRHHMLLSSGMSLKGSCSNSPAHGVPSQVEKFPRKFYFLASSQISSATFRATTHRAILQPTCNRTQAGGKSNCKLRTVWRKNFLLDFFSLSVVTSSARQPRVLQWFLAAHFHLACIFGVLSLSSICSYASCKPILGRAKVRICSCQIKINWKQINPTKEQNFVPLHSFVRLLSDGLKIKIWSAIWSEP